MKFTDEERRTIKSAFRAALCEISAQGTNIKNGYHMVLQCFAVLYGIKVFLNYRSK